MNPLLITIIIIGALLAAMLGAAVFMIIFREGYRALIPSLLPIAIAGVLEFTAVFLIDNNRVLRLATLYVAAGLLTWACAGLFHRGYRLSRLGRNAAR